MTNYEWLKRKIEYLKHNPTDECVEWPFGRYGDYGSVYIAKLKRTCLVHRTSYELYYNAIPINCVLHSCDHPICYNPLHLRDGTDQDNAIDAVKRNRYKGGAVRLTVDQVLRIMKWFEQGLSNQEIARRVNRAESTISNIRRGSNWRWLTKYNPENPPW